MDAPINVDELETASLVSASGEAAWVGGYFAYGGNGAERSTVIYFAVPAGSSPRRASSSTGPTRSGPRI